MTYRLNWPLNVEQVSGSKKKKKSGAGSAPAITSRGGQGM